MDVKFKNTVEVYIDRYIHIDRYSALHTKSITPILCAVPSAIVNVTFLNISDVLHLCPQEAAKISKVAIVSSFKVSLVFVKIGKVGRLL